MVRPIQPYLSKGDEESTIKCGRKPRLWVPSKRCTHTFYPKVYLNNLKFCSIQIHSDVLSKILTDDFVRELEENITSKYRQKAPQETLDSIVRALQRLSGVEINHNHTS